MENNTTRFYGKLFQTDFCGIAFDAADEMHTLLLQLVKIAMVLISSIHNTGLIGLKNLIDKCPFSSIAIGKKEFLWY